jgi:formylglycine-generating enzyme required for sulfatase activity
MSTCVQCGNSLKTDDRFCSECGTPVTSAPSTASPDLSSVDDILPINGPARFNFYLADLHEAELPDWPPDDDWFDIRAEEEIQRHWDWLSAKRIWSPYPILSYCLGGSAAGAFSEPEEKRNLAALLSKGNHYAEKMSVRYFLFPTRKPHVQNQAVAQLICKFEPGCKATDIKVWVDALRENELEHINLEDIRIALQMPTALPGSLTENLNGVELEMVLIPAGTFKMGSPEDSSFDYGRPQHDVTVPSFYIGQYPITQAQWQAVMGTNPSNFKDDGNLPVESVSWNGAKEFCKKLSEITGKEYRLPSEAEWEYACRAGTTGDHAGKPYKMAWCAENSGGQTHPVGQKEPNAFGLYDMHGNVWEWCEDVQHYFYKGAPSDGSAWTSGGDQSSRMIRGGCWYDDLDLCSSYWRGQVGADNREPYTGFRVAVSATATSR